MASQHIIKVTVEAQLAATQPPNGPDTPASRLEDLATPPSTKTASISYTPVPVPATADVPTPSYPKLTLGEELPGLFSENVVAKIYRTATRFITRSSEAQGQAIPPFIPQGFPEYVPQQGHQTGRYTFREPAFWTCGFFPGSLHCILERLVRYPRSVHLPSRHSPDIARLRSDMSALCEQWAEPLHAMSKRTDTHDVGFIVMPALQKSWELTGNRRSLDSILGAARSLGSRFVPQAGAIRSWDRRIQGNLEITGSDNLILIIDSMCNLDLLYYAASHDPKASRLADMATAHATTVMRTHLRPEATHSASEESYKGQWYSTYHVANLDAATGAIKQQFTAQGYSDTSTWARGQAWGILGYAQTYMWTKDRKFLQASCGLAEYFLHRLDTSNPCVEIVGDDDCTVDGATSGRHRRGRYVPLWDFDAPIDDASNPTRDSSAGAIAANGMLVLSQGLAGLGHDRLATRFRTAAVDIVRDLLNFALSAEGARLVTGEDGSVGVEDRCAGQTFEALMRDGTANNNVNAPRRYANHGLVYGDYYLLEFGNRLLRMGFE